MPSHYLGKALGSNNASWEIHAFTRRSSWREFGASEIADADLYTKLLKGRYQVLNSLRPIYCTAVNPNSSQCTEENPHDDRDGSVHVVALDDAGEIECAVSVAVDLNEQEEGTRVGLPLENAWRAGDYPAGASLDSFRSRFVRLHYDEDRDVQPWEMAELYRHWKAPSRGNGELARVGVYAGCFELLVEAAQRSDRVPSWLWVFDAIPQYFLLYTFDGAGFLRDPAIAKPPRLLTPVKECLESIKRDGRRQVRCDDEVVSREVLVPIPEKRDGELIFRREFVPFLDGVVDIRRRQELIKKGVIVPLLA